MRQKDMAGGVLVQVEFDIMCTKSPHAGKGGKLLQFDLILDPTFPLTPPKLVTLSSVSHAFFKFAVHISVFGRWSRSVAGRAGEEVGELKYALRGRPEPSAICGTLSSVTLSTGRLFG